MISLIEINFQYQNAGEISEVQKRGRLFDFI